MRLWRRKKKTKKLPTRKACLSAHIRITAECKQATRSMDTNQDSRKIQIYYINQASEQHCATNTLSLQNALKSDKAGTSLDICTLENMQ